LATAQLKKVEIKTKPVLKDPRMQGFAADPVYVKGEVFAYVGLLQNLKDPKGSTLKGPEDLKDQKDLSFRTTL
jgi:hypothetical protein